tara:strand:+ start:969 stop:1703 length:735 start_codon:yes stop_codon:yes gene_type:complete
MGKKARSKSKKRINFPPVETLDLIKLVELARSRKKQQSDIAFNEIMQRMKSKLQQISYKFHIPGKDHDDIYQEALFALRYKAIKDYDKERGNNGEPYPFDKFAILCIRRHLSTILKSSYQNKKKVLNQSLSLDQERNDISEDVLFLSDILPATKETVLESINSREYYRTLFSKLFAKLSQFEKQVFIFYRRKYSYEEIAVKISKIRRKTGEPKVGVKAIDNALSRAKSKGKKIFEIYGENNEID